MRSPESGDGTTDISDLAISFWKEENRDSEFTASACQAARFPVDLMARGTRVLAERSLTMSEERKETKKVKTEKHRVQDLKPKKDETEAEGKNVKGGGDYNIGPIGPVGPGGRR